MQRHGFRASLMDDNFRNLRTQSWPLTSHHKTLLFQFLNKRKEIVLFRLSQKCNVLNEIPVHLELYISYINFIFVYFTELNENSIRTILYFFLWFYTIFGLQNITEINNLIFRNFIIE